MLWSKVASYGAPERPEEVAHGHQALLIRNDATGRPFEWDFQRGEERVPVAPSGRLLVNDTGSLLGACLGGAGIAQ